MSADGNGVPAKMGRPPKLVETEEIIKQIEGLSRIHCTMVEAAAVLGVHRDTFSDFLQAHEKAMAAWEDGKENGKASLRRMQFKAAESGNPTMQIWLGKQWLDQKDSFVHAGDPNNPIVTRIELTAPEGHNGSHRVAPEIAASIFRPS